MTEAQFISLLFMIGACTIWIIVFISIAAEEIVKRVTKAMDKE